MTGTLYTGTSRKLVIAFDIGTTYSGAAYAFLDRGEAPKITPVTKYLDNPNVGSAKVPSILYYDQEGNFRGVENGTGLQEDKSLLRLRWWKLLLEPKPLQKDLKDQMSERLPKGKSIVDVFSDIMRYLFNSTKAQFISSLTEIGQLRWDSVADNTELVLTHPNGWGGPQQCHLRNSAIRAGIVPDTPKGYARVHFVTEGEASFNFCAIHSLPDEKMKSGTKVLIVDAGGGTIDISSYVVKKPTPLQVEELYQSECLVQGGEFVTMRATKMVREKLKTSKFDSLKDVEDFSRSFDEGLKRTFFGEKGQQYIKFRNARAYDSNHGIKGGKLVLPGKQVSEFFEPSIQTTVNSIKGNLKKAFPEGSFAFLVGGFGASPWLASQLNQRLSGLGLKFFKSDTNTDKAAAVGAVSFYINHLVQGRITKFAYGVPYCVSFKSSDPDHFKRKHKVFTDELGHKYLPDAFDTMLSKGSKVLETRTIRTTLDQVFEGSPKGSVFARIIKYDGHQKSPKWIDVERDRFETLCHVVADLSAAPYTRRAGSSGGVCYYREFDVVLLVGLTELKAEIRWYDPKTMKEKRSDARVEYYDSPEDGCAGPRVPPPLYNDLK